MISWLNDGRHTQCLSFAEPLNTGRIFSGNEILFLLTHVTKNMVIIMVLSSNTQRIVWVWFRFKQILAGRIALVNYICQDDINLIARCWSFMDVSLKGIPYHLRLVCTPLCICCSSSTYRIIQGLLTRESEIQDFFVGKLWANLWLRTLQSKSNIYGTFCHMTRSADVWLNKGMFGPVILKYLLILLLDIWTPMEFAVWADIHRSIFYPRYLYLNTFMKY